MRWFYAATLCCLLGGCVASTEVKQASTQVGVALAELQKAQAALADVYVRELEEVRQLAGRAIVADAVVHKVGELKQAEIDGDLIEISEAISHEREAYRRMVDQILGAERESGQSDEDVVQAVLDARIAALRQTAGVLEQAGATESATELRQQADALEADPSHLAQFDDMVNLVVLAATQQEARAAIKDLEQYIGLLQTIHAQVNEWIATDVKVDGAELAGVIQAAEAQFGNATGGTP